MINSLGEGLSIVIDCEYIPLHNWMAFASWYSISKNLPDAKVTIACKRTMPIQEVFVWPKKCNINFFMHNGNMQYNDILKIKPSVMAIRSYDENCIGPIDVKSNDLTTFVDYSNGVGMFVIATWIDSSRPPFDNAVTRFGSDDMTINELKILQVWQQLFGLYAAL